MMRYAVFMLLALLAAAPAVAQDVYRWVDANGTVHYSDKPRDGAERVQIRSVQGYESGTTANPTASDPAAVQEEPEGPYYTAVRIVSPENDGAVWATGGGMTVQVEVQPALRPGDKIQLTLNGDIVPGTPVANTSITLSGLIRGAYTVQAAVVGPSQQIFIFSDDVNFNVLQASIHSPQRRP